MLDAMRRSPAGQGREPPASHPAKRHDSMIQVAALRISNWPGSAVAQSPAVRRLAFCESLRRLFCQPLARCVTDPVFRGTSPRFTVERPLATVASETLAHLSPSPLHPSSQAECRGFDPHHPLHSPRPEGTRDARNTLPLLRLQVGVERPNRRVTRSLDPGKAPLRVRQRV